MWNALRLGFYPSRGPDASSTHFDFTLRAWARLRSYVRLSSTYRCRNLNAPGGCHATLDGFGKGD